MKRKGAADYGHIVSGWIRSGAGIWYRMRSMMEMNYSRYLDFLIRQKQIRSWRYEPDTFWFEGIRRGTNSYKPDFLIEHLDGSLEYVEVKGYLDAKSVTKLRRMKIYHPHIKLRYVDKQAFKAVARWCKVIPNWIYAKDQVLSVKPDDTTQAA